MANEPIKIDSGDVYIHPIPVEMCERCEDDDSDPAKYAGVPATKIVTLDLRGSGQEITIGVYCDKCAEESAFRLRESLPKEQPE